MTQFFKPLAPVAALITALSLSVPGIALASSGSERVTNEYRVSDDDRASGDYRVTDEVRAAITTTLEAQGYQVFTIETERGDYEVMAARNGRLWELRLNADYAIIRSEIED